MTSRSTYYRKKKKEDDPEAYGNYLERQRLDGQRRRAEEKRRWEKEPHTRAQEEMRETQRKKHNDRALKSYYKRKASSERQTRSSQATKSPSEKRHKDLNAEERREYNAKMRKRQRDALSSQKKTADKMKRRREYHAKREVEARSKLPTLPSTQETRLPQKAYYLNYHYKFKSESKQFKLTHEEYAQTTLNLLNPRTPEKSLFARSKIGSANHTESHGNTRNPPSILQQVAINRPTSLLHECIFCLKHTQRMTGRGRGRAKIRPPGDEADAPGGLKESHGNTEGQTNADSKPTLSLGDIKSILQDSRTYSDQNDVKKVLMCAQHFVRSKEDVNKMAELIYNKCMEDSSLAKRGAEICDSLSGIEVNGAKFRNCLLLLIQTDYTARKKLKNDNPTHFNSFLAFLCEVFSIMRTTTNEVFKPLVPAIFDCFDLVLGKKEDNDDDEASDGEMAAVDEDSCDVLSLQLLSTGRLLEQNGDDRMRYLMDRVRTCIIHSKSSPRIRCGLLEVIESYARGWESASNDTTKFYCDMAVDIISGLAL